MVAILLGGIQGNALLQVGTGRDKLAEIQQAISQGAVRLQEECWVVLTLGEGEEPLSQLTGGAHVSLRLIKPPEAKQHREDLTGISQLLAGAPQQGLIGGLLDHGVLEAVGHLWR
jgi:hypothetical protein